MTELFLENLPDSNEIWRGIGGHFDSLGQIVAEFIDNSVANIEATNPDNKSISINFHDLNEQVIVQVEDTGSGIIDLDDAFRLGGRRGRQGPLNEHGFGMKHALASANQSNDQWMVCTRTQDNFSQGKYKRISAPYFIDNQPVQLVSVDEFPWPGKFNGSGTYIEFSCSREMFNTLQSGMPGKAGFSKCISYLIEDLGFIYSGLISKNTASFTVSWETENETDSKSVAAVTPSWEQYYPPGEGKEDFDLGNGKVTLRYAFGAMKESDYKRYYRRNMSSSGLEIRLNGRVLANNLFKAVWNRERHNMYNHLLVLVDVISDDPERLPATRTSKNGLRKGDPRLEALYEWVRRHLPSPKKEIPEATDEKDLFEELRNQKNFHIPDPKTVEIEQYVFEAFNEKVRVDLYIAETNRVWVYEGKKDKTTVRDVYQLMLYWDGATIDDLNPTKGILISAEHPDSVRRMIEHVNGMSGVSGKKYNFELKTWREEGIEYPE